jgi:hypothetical protein
MYELISFDDHQTQTYGQDAFGEFGSIFASDTELAIPGLSDFQSDPQFAVAPPTLSQSLST